MSSNSAPRGNNDDPRSREAERFALPPPRPGRQPSRPTPLALARVRRRAPRRWRRLAHRAFDITLALALLGLFSWVFVLAAVVAVVGRSRPILYAQVRLGQGDTTFRCLKFRTMRTDADAVLEDILTADRAAADAWSAGYKLPDDPRVTRFGRLLRRFDLDEVPQLINVLLGEMSIVGPRPIVPTEAERFGDALAVTRSVRPGLTGPWQVSGRNSISQEERVQMNVDYVLNRTLLGDLVICARTPAALLRSNLGR